MSACTSNVMLIYVYVICLMIQRIESRANYLFRSMIEWFNVNDNTIVRHRMCSDPIDRKWKIPNVIVPLLALGEPSFEHWLVRTIQAVSLWCCREGCGCRLAVPFWKVWQHEYFVVCVPGIHSRQGSLVDASSLQTFRLCCYSWRSHKYHCLEFHFPHARCNSLYLQENINSCVNCIWQSTLGHHTDTASHSRFL